MSNHSMAMRVAYSMGPALLQRREIRSIHASRSSAISRCWYAGSTISNSLIALRTAVKWSGAATTPMNVEVPPRVRKIRQVGGAFRFFRVTVSVCIVYTKETHQDPSSVRERGLSSMPQSGGAGDAALKACAIVQRAY
jgi:hypothetical protein